MDPENPTPAQPEAITPDETLVLEPLPDDTEDVEVLKQQVAEKDAFARQAVARAKKAEEELKVLKKPKDPTPVSPPTANIEETVLLATGMPEELVEQLKAVAQVRKVSLIKAQTDPIFLAVKEKFEKDQKQKDASLPASRGSGGSKPKKDLTTPGLSREEHMALAKAALAK